ncbi:hypothetical protein ABH903_003392 [Brevibacterium epidermidis]|uniref:Uncharacterized protein n=1 Tax=Brevibacterium epidermidis TaxID=1698 RepID=A0ABV4EQ33_BREEP
MLSNTNAICPESHMSASSRRSSTCGTPGARGFDDAAFADLAGNLSEATIWNLAFFDSTTAIWLKAAMLPGVTMQILQRQLRRQGIAQERRPWRLRQSTPPLHPPS